MELKLTNEEKESIKYYKNEMFDNIKQFLNSDSTVDIYSLCDENEEIKVNYDKVNIVNLINIIKKVYESILKSYYSRGIKEDWSFSKKVQIVEIEKMKNEPYIDNFLTVDTEAHYNEDLVGINHTIVKIKGNKDIPYIKLSEIIDGSKEILIAPFTIVKEVKANNEIKDEDKKICTYEVSLDRQELQEMSDDDKIALYNYILSNSDLINVTLSNTVTLEKENISNYESIRELEKKVSDLENSINQKEQENDYPESEKNADNLDLKELNDRLEILKNRSTDIFNNIKSNNKFITEWKKNIIVYLMAECADIEEKLISEMKIENKENNKEAEI